MNSFSQGLCFEPLKIPKNKKLKSNFLYYGKGKLTDIPYIKYVYSIDNICWVQNIRSCNTDYIATGYLKGIAIYTPHKDTAFAKVEKILSLNLNEDYLLVKYKNLEEK